MKQLSIVVGMALVIGLFGATACAPKQEVVCAMPPLIGYVMPQDKPK